MAGRPVIERGWVGDVPFAAVGTGRPLVVMAGLSLGVGVDSDRLVRQVLLPVRGLAGRRRLVVLNRWPGLPEGLSLGDIAAGYSAVLARWGGPADVMGVSTGGSIAQVVAAGSPALVRRLALVSTACRLSPELRSLQAEVAALLRDGRAGAAAALIAGSAAPYGLRGGARAIGRLAGGRLFDADRARDLRITLEAEDPFDLAALPGSIQAPTVIVGGGRDRFYPTSLFEETARLVPRSELLLRPRRGHVSVVNDRRTVAHLTGFFGAGSSEDEDIG